MAASELRQILGGARLPRGGVYTPQSKLAMGNPGGPPQDCYPFKWLTNLSSTAVAFLKIILAYTGCSVL